jgi:hypothetical protein
MLSGGSTGAERQLPLYNCHKQVWALKIAKIEKRDDVVYLTPADEGYAEFPLEPEYVWKHQPKAGGYYVVYKDGYKSFSPAEAFEEGYTLAETVIR